MQMVSRHYVLGGCALALLACQPQPSAPAPRNLAPVRAASNLAATNAIQRYYPIEPGRKWTFALEQRQNGQDNTKFKTLNMEIEPLPGDGAIEQAVLRRSYPDSTTVPTPTLIRRFGDRVELSRYHSTVVSAFAPQMEQEIQGQGYIVAMQLPFEAGKNWEGRLFNGGRETIRIAGEETLTVPAGTFKTLKIEHHLQYNNGKEDFLRYWYAPDVGMVKLYEELTFYYGQWLKFQSTGVLTQYSAPPAR